MAGNSSSGEIKTRKDPVHIATLETLKSAQRWRFRFGVAGSCYIPLVDCDSLSLAYFTEDAHHVMAQYMPESKN